MDTIQPMDEELHCAFCHDKYTQLEFIVCKEFLQPRHYHVHCPGCGKYGPGGLKPDIALQHWRHWLSESLN